MYIYRVVYDGRTKVWYILSYNAIMVAYVHGLATGEKGSRGDKSIANTNAHANAHDGDRYMGTAAAAARNVWE